MIKEDRPMPFTLPGEAHVPGQTPRPESSPAFDAAAAAPAYTVDRMWSENDTYLYGIALYAAQYFWEAHEVWEPVWMRAPGNSRERYMMQGLIQLANACLKVRMARHGAAVRLLSMASGHFGDAGLATPRIMGLDAVSLARQTDLFRGRVEIGGNKAAVLAERPALLPAP